MKASNSSRELSVRCGKATDGAGKLRALCKEEARRLAETLSFPPHQAAMSVAFWTTDEPSDLICVGNFAKGEGGAVTFGLDFSQTTLWHFCFFEHAEAALPCCG